MKANWIKRLPFVPAELVVFAAIPLGLLFSAVLFSGCDKPHAAVGDQASYRQVVASTTTTASTSKYTTWDAREFGQEFNRYRQLIIFVSYESALQTGDSCFIGTSVDNGTTWFPVAFKAIDSTSTGLTAEASARSLTTGNRKEAYYVTVPVGPDMYFKVKTNATVATRQWSIWALYRDF